MDILTGTSITTTDKRNVTNHSNQERKAPIMYNSNTRNNI